MHGYFLAWVQFPVTPKFQGRSSLFFGKHKVVPSPPKAEVDSEVAGLGGN